jgi:hypothetical protein
MEHFVVGERSIRLVTSLGKRLSSSDQVAGIDSRRVSSPAELADVSSSVVSDSRPTVAWWAIATDRPQASFWYSVVISLMEGFALYGAAIHSMASFSVEPCSPERKLSDRAVPLSPGTNVNSLVSFSENQHIAPSGDELDARTTPPSGVEDLHSDDGSLDDSVRSCRWSWLTSPKKTIVAQKQPDHCAQGIKNS